MRKTYIRPMMNSEEFVTNEYITTCDPSEKGYLIECITAGHDSDTFVTMEKPTENIMDSDGFGYLFGGWYYEDSTDSPKFNHKGNNISGYLNYHRVKISPNLS